jgi:nanoRNase/pAp phosphatase (c-di-AMP/oligoRNAs hydrolase)
LLRSIATEKFLDAVRFTRNVLILPHNDPDPDAIASALALEEILRRMLNLQTRICYKGIIGRSENRALVHYLGNPLQVLTDADFEQADAVALIDTQPGTGNNPLPKGQIVSIVIDHHPYYPETQTCIYVDIPSGYGASSSMMTEYLQVFGIEPNQKLATALYYGIITDTRGLSRGTSQADIDAYLYLQPKIDHEALANIEFAPVPDSYFKTLVDTIGNARRYGNVVIAYCGTTGYPDMAAEMADFLLRIKDTEWVICTNTYQEDLFISVRSTRLDADAGSLIKVIVGLEGTAGGHGMMAGGQIPLAGKNPLEVSSIVHQRALQLLDIPEKQTGEPLLGLE